MVFRILKSIKALPFLSVNRKKAGPLAGRPDVADYDPGPPTTTILYEETRECQHCGHFGSPFPVRTNDQIDYSSFAGCLRPGAERIVELPHEDCVFWQESRFKTKKPPK